MNQVLTFMTLLFILTGSHLDAASASERAALVAFYNSTNGTSWTNKDGWLADDPCANSWYGADCDK